MMEARMANSCLARRLPRLKRMKSTTRRAKIQGKVLRTLHLIECLVNPAQDERASAGHLYGAASVLFFLKRRSEWVLSASKLSFETSTGVLKKAVAFSFRSTYWDACLQFVGWLTVPDSAPSKVWNSSLLGSQSMPVLHCLHKSISLPTRTRMFLSPDRQGFGRPYPCKPKSNLVLTYTSLGVGGVIYSPHTLQPIEKLGLEARCALEKAHKISNLQPESLADRLLKASTSSRYQGLQGKKASVKTLVVKLAAVFTSLYSIWAAYSHREFVVDLRKRLQGVWNVDALAEHGEHMNKLAKYHHWMALPMRPLSAHGTPFPVPRSTHQLVIGVTKENFKMKHAVFLCTFYYSQASSEDVIHFLHKQTNETYLGTVEQTEQPNYLAEVGQAEQPNYLAEGQILLQPC
eukprot:1161877-Pelagomonas_calceolata.AAC.4